MQLPNLVEEADQGSYWTPIYPKSLAKKTESCELSDWGQICSRPKAISLCTLLMNEMQALCPMVRVVNVSMMRAVCVCEDLCVHTDWALCKVCERTDQRSRSSFGTSKTGIPWGSVDLSRCSFVVRTLLFWLHHV